MLYFIHSLSVQASSRAFEHCAACGQAIAEQFATRGFDFLLEAFNDPSFLERAAGLDEFYKLADAGYAAWDEEEDEIDSESEA